MSKLDIVFIIKSMNTTGGGAERVLADVAGGLAERGHKITVVTYDGPGETSFYPLDPRISLLQLGIGRARRSASSTETWRRIIALREMLGERKPDLVVGFMHSVYIPLALALFGTGIPLVASEHMIWPYYRDRRLEAALLRLSSLRMKRFTIPTPQVAQSFPPEVRRKMVVLPNAIRHITGNSRANVGEAHLLLSVGRLEPQKDQITLIRAFGLLADRFPTWHLRILGEGELRPQLEGEVRRLGLEERVSLPGASSDIFSEYAKAGVFVIPSLFESFGLVTGEALAMGIPAVGFADCPGTNEMIANDRNGLLVDDKDRVRSLAAGLAELMGSPERRAALGANGPDSVARFAIEPIVDSWEDLLFEVAGQAVPARTSPRPKRVESNASPREDLVANGLSEDPFGSSAIRQMNWYGLKGLVSSVLRLPIPNRLASKSLNMFVNSNFAERLPVPVKSVDYLLADGRKVTLHSPEVDQVAKYIYWGGGVIRSPADARVLRFVEKLAPDLDDFVDVGAYTGIFALVVGVTNPNVRLHTFEVVPENHLLLLKNLIFSGLHERTRAHLTGLARQPGSIRVPPTLGMASLASSVSLGSLFENGLDISLRRLDDYLDDLGERVAIKIDVEGFEHDVIAGGRHLIASRRPAVVCEILETSVGHAEIEGFFRSIQYDFYLSTPSGFEKRSSIEPTREGRDWIFMPEGRVLTS